MEDRIQKYSPVSLDYFGHRVQILVAFSDNMWYVYRSTSVVQDSSFQGSSILREHVFPGRYVQKIVSPRTLDPTLTVTQRTQQHLYMVLGILVCTGLVAQLQWLASGRWSQLNSILLWCWTQTYEPYLCCPTHASPSALSIFYLPLFHIDQHPQSLEIEQLTPTILTLHLQHSHHSPLTFTHHWPLTTLTPSFYFILPMHVALTELSKFQANQWHCTFAH